MRALGKYGEDTATTYLRQHEHRILKRNYYTRFGEIDIFSRKGGHLHVIEVKMTRRGPVPIGYKINRRKKKRMIQSTCLFLDQYNLWSLYVQFDLITVVGNQVNHMQNIFSLTDV